MVGDYPHWLNTKDFVMTTMIKATNHQEAEKLIR